MSFEICGDEQEQHRIELEHNLQNTELSFHISTDDERGTRRQMECSVEYPRHISEPSLAEYPSFVHRSREHSMGDDMHSPHRAWSHRTGEDEDGVSPFGAETMSTVAHHASAVTISAGLGGGRTARTRDPSLSGAEYDPDRPLHAMISGVNADDPLKSKQITFDPIVVDNTAELDRLLESGHARPPQPSMRSRSVRLTPPVSPGSSSTSDDAGPGHQTPRPRLTPRLTDHLRHVSFSPSRPRSAQGLPPPSPVAPRRSHRMAAELSTKSINVSTPRPPKRPLAHSPLPVQVRLHPATPSTAGSKFTRMAKGITKDIEATQHQSFSHRVASSSSRPAPPIERNPFHDEPDAILAAPRMPPPSRKSSLKDTTRSRIYLPDVTGLTNAVESPLRFGTKYYPYRTDRPRDNEARLLQTLSAVQSQLHELEEENSISRRRVRELELELEDCKREVVRERTRLIEREEFRKGDVSFRVGSSSRAKGKNKARDVSGLYRPELDDEKLRVRYKEAVDEKKALEALVGSLRSHLTRLTAELSSHQELLVELKRLREQDSRALQEKSNEILQLREEVQRLAGEVEVLRGVVEEGLKERRASKESIQIDLDEDEEVEEKDDFARSRQEVDDDAGIAQDDDDDDDDDEEEEEIEMEELGHHTETFDPPGDKTIRTDRATLGESTNNNSKGAGAQFVVDEDLDKIAAEVEERRSNVSNGSILSAIPRSPSPMRRPSKNGNHHNQATVESAVDVDHRQHSRSHVRQTEPLISRPVASTIVEAGGSRPPPGRRDHDDHDDEGLIDPDPETPFPMIRGEQLERLFFSVPEHNAKTCGVCYRKRDRRYSGPSTSFAWTRKPASWAHQHEEGEEARKGREGPVDEHFRGYGAGANANATARDGKKKQNLRDGDGEENVDNDAGENQGLPPQTVVGRVIRELEDDFTHYKSVYVELADQYKVMDAVSDVRRRNMLAQHLREVVDILEQKGDQIASLYGVLTFRDRPRPVSPIRRSRR